MQVRFYATLRPLVGARAVEIALPANATVRELVEAVVTQYPALRDILLDERGRVPRGVHVFVNGRGAGYLARGWDTLLASEDHVDIFPAVAGG